MTTEKLHQLCVQLISVLQNDTSSPDISFQAGFARFRLFEKQLSVHPWAQKHFQSFRVSDSDAQIYLSDKGSLAEPFENLFHDLWYQQIIQKFAEIGIYGYYDKEIGQLEFFDPEQNKGVRVLRSAQDMPLWESSTPVGNFVNWVNANKGATMIHGATLATDKFGALMVGRGGSGKSLLTLAGVGAGLRTVGDDYAIVSQGESNQYFARPYSAMAKQTPEGLKFLGKTGASFGSTELNWQGKHIFKLGVEKETALPVDVIIAPFIGKNTLLKPAKTSTMFRSLVESTSYQLPATAKRTNSFCGDLARNKPIFEFEMGPNVNQNAHYLRDFLKEFSEND